MRSVSTFCSLSVYWISCALWLSVLYLLRMEVNYQIHINHLLAMFVESESTWTELPCGAGPAVLRRSAKIHSRGKKKIWEFLNAIIRESVVCLSCVLYIMYVEGYSERVCIIFLLLLHSFNDLLHLYVLIREKVLYI